MSKGGSIFRRKMFVGKAKVGLWIAGRGFKYSLNFAVGARRNLALEV